MAIIIETCPKCGHDLMDVILPTNPPISKKECCGCGWSWTGKQEEVIRVPFGGNSFYQDDKYSLIGNIYADDANCESINSNEYIYKINKIDLDSIPKISYDDIVAAVERTKEYLRY